MCRFAEQNTVIVGQTTNTPYRQECGNGVFNRLSGAGPGWRWRGNDWLTGGGMAPSEWTRNANGDSVGRPPRTERTPALDRVTKGAS